jgi:hypothetical protein
MEAQRIDEIKSTEEDYVLIKRCDSDLHSEYVFAAKCRHKESKALFFIFWILKDFNWFLFYLLCQIH